MPGEHEIQLQMPLLLETSSYIMKLSLGPLHYLLDAIESFEFRVKESGNIYFVSLEIGKL